MKRLLVIGIMYTMFFLIGNIHLHADERTNVKEITSLEEPTWRFRIYFAEKYTIKGKTNES